jgi:hypothetical protein
LIYAHDACPARIAANGPRDASANTSNLANARRFFPSRCHAARRKARPGVLSDNGMVVA